MFLFKNVSGQKWIVFAWDVTTGLPKTGDAANITAKISKDYAAAAATNDTNPTEIEDGYYAFDLTQAETNAAFVQLLPESSTSNIVVVGCPAAGLTDNVTAIATSNYGILSALNDPTLEEIFTYGLSSGNVDTFSSATSVTLDTGAPATADLHKDAFLYIYSGPGAGECQQIVEYTVGRVCTLDPGFVSTLTTSSKYIVLPAAVTPTSNLPSVITDSFSITAKAEIEVEVEDGLADYDAATATDVTTAVGGLNDLSAAEVNAEVDTALADYDPPTKAELDAGLGALNDLSAAEVNAEVDTALADYDAPTKAELDAGLSGLNDLSAADIATALATYDAPTKAELDAGLAALNDLSLTDILDAAAQVDGYTLRQVLAVMFAILAGQVTGAATDTPVFTRPDGTQTRYTGSGQDSDGNRGAPTIGTTGIV